MTRCAAIWLKQINEAFTSSKTTAFQQVVLVEFPAPAFIRSDS